MLVYVYTSPRCHTSKGSLHSPENAQRTVCAEPRTQMDIYSVPIQLSPTPYFLFGKGANLINCNIDLFSVPLLSDLNRPLLKQEGDRN